MNVKAGIVIQARMGSTRMPGKVLTPFYGDQSILDIIIRTVLSHRHSLPVIIATSDNIGDDVIVAAAKRNGVFCFRGSESDVLQRFIDAADQFGFTHVIRICADNPLLDVTFLDELIEKGFSSSADYISFEVGQGVPAIRSHWGIFGEWVSVHALKQVNAETHDAFYHEHVTNYLYGHPEKFNVEWIRAAAGIYGRNDMRFTIDTPEDFSMVREIYSHFADNRNSPNFREIIKLVELHPEWMRQMKSRIDQFTK